MDELYFDRFQLLRQLGKGGMGEVWLAHDPRLGRKVAIKTLPPGKATPSARQRFQREIRSLAACNHPVIARIYEAGEAAWPTEPEKTVSFIVMELVNGETLKQRISRGPVPPAKALSIVCQALDGLAAAHDNQLVHRDIKPSNLMITSAGEVKLLDLGLARFVQTDASRKETARPASMGDLDPETTLTCDGDLIGTPAYMSPEQALSKRIDARADIWAVGLLLFEMLTGERAIKARSSAEALIKIPGLSLDPKLLPKGTSLRLVQILRRCLSQDLRLRYHHARDLLYDLRLVQEDQEGTNRAWRSSPLGWVLSLCLGIALAALVAVFPRSVTQPVQGTIDLGFDGYSPVLSPDGTRIFYVGEDGREIRMAAASATGNHQQVLSPGQIVKNLAVSPDSSWIFFDQLDEDGTSQVFRVPAAGGASRWVTTGWAPAVSQNGELVSFFEWANTTHKGLWICRADGGDRRLVTVLDGPLEPLSNCFTADGKQILVSRTDHFSRSEILRIDPERGGSETLIVIDGGASTGLAALPGERSVVWGADLPTLGIMHNALVLSRLDKGTSTRLSLGVARYEYPSLSADGTLALIRASEVQYSPFVEITFDPSSSTPAGSIKPLPITGSQPRVSPGGRFIVYISILLDVWLLERTSETKKHLATLGEYCTNPTWHPSSRAITYTSLRDSNVDIWMASTDERSNRRLTDDPANDFQPCWHPDGIHLVWISDRDGIESLYCMNTLNGRIHRLTDEIVGNPAISPDGSLIAFVVQGPASRSVRLHTLSDGLQLGPLIWRHDTGFDKVFGAWIGFRPRFSPDGKWLGFNASVEPSGGDIFIVKLSNHMVSPPARLFAFPPTSTIHSFDWIDSNHLVVSHAPSRARLLLLGDADHWFDRALVGG